AMTIENVRLYEQNYRAYDDLRRTQEQLLQSEKMSAVGQLISGVAHELNKPLTAVLGYAQLLEAEPISQRAREFVQKIFRQARGGRLRVRLFAENAAVCAELHDSGPGLRDTKRIFDPFFTTKQVGKGTGLGLSICYGIVKEHGGEIQGSNHPEGGAVFQVHLP